MEKIKIGVLCPSEIAFRRFLPALQQSQYFEYIGVAVAAAGEWFGEPTPEQKEAEQAKAQKFADSYAGKIFKGYGELLNDQDVEAVYVPLPPALHYNWAKKALLAGKHVLLEKPFCTNMQDTEDLLNLAAENHLAVHENYMFVYHSQLTWIREHMAEIGELRLIRIDFGFPFRGANDFRYNRELGGGALLDCGGYTLKLAGYFLGNSARITTSQLNMQPEFGVDIGGSATFTNDQGLTAQVAFGMDNSYKCSLELWGSKGTLYTNRVLTAPVGYEPQVIIKTVDKEQVYTLPADDSFGKSIAYFGECIENEAQRIEHYAEIRQQAQLVAEIRERK